MKQELLEETRQRLQESLEQITQDAISSRAELLQERLDELRRQLGRLARAARVTVCPELIHEIVSAENERSAVRSTLVDLLALSNDPLLKTSILCQLFPRKSKEEKA